MARCPNCGAAVDPADEECDICDTEVEGFVAVPGVGRGPVGDTATVSDRGPLLTVVLYLLGSAIAVASVGFVAVGGVDQGRMLGIAGLVVAVLFVAGGTVFAVRDRS